jgi:UDP-sugar transporter A1/2/3
VQTVAVALALRYTRIMATNKSDLYIPTTAVFLTEVIKLATCLGKISFDMVRSKESLPAAFHAVWRRVFLDEELLKMIVPAAMYAIQNNLIYIAASNLDPIVSFHSILTRSPSHSKSECNSRLYLLHFSLG